MTQEVATKIDTQYGSFNLAYHELNDKRFVTLSVGDITVGTPLVRLQSACLFGEAFLSMHCDCRQQLAKALFVISESSCGILVYGVDEDGRGIGIANKIRSMSLEASACIDTVEAFKLLGFVPDERQYNDALEILNSLKTSKNIKLLTLNPNKSTLLAESGYNILENIPLAVDGLSEKAEKEIQVKKEKLGHHKI